MSARRVLITGVSAYLGAALAKSLEASSDVEYIAGVDVMPPPLDLDRTEFIKADIRNPLIRRVIASTGADTVVHTALTSGPAWIGGRSAQKERNVIGTMQLLAACQRSERLQRLVVRSSTAVYGIDPSAPSILREDWSTRAGPKDGYSKDVVEAESLARDFARRRPDVNVTVLRMSNMVGPKIHTNITQFFSLPLIPAALGFDPRLQLLHEDDALEVLRRAVLEDHLGVFNVAPDGVIYLSQAIRIAERLPFPILTPFVPLLADAMRAARVIDFPTDQIELLVHGRVVDNSRLKEVFGYEPKFSTIEAFRDFIASRGREVWGPGMLVEAERTLYDFVVGEGIRRLESVLRRASPPREAGESK